MVEAGSKVKAHLGQYENMILNCLDLAIEKVDFLTKIPQLSQSCVKSDERIASQKESDLLDAIYDLFLCQLAWIASKKNRRSEIQCDVDEEEDDDEYVNHITDAASAHDHARRSSRKNQNLRKFLRIPKNQDKLGSQHEVLRSVVPAVSKQLKHEDEAISGVCIRDFEDDETKTSLFWNFEMKDSRKPTHTSTTSLRKMDPKLTSSLSNDLTSSHTLHSIRFFEGKCLWGQTSTSSDFISRLFQTSSENTEESYELSLSSTSTEKLHFDDEVITLLNCGGKSRRIRSNDLSPTFQSKNNENESQELGLDPHVMKSQTIFEPLKKTHHPSNDDNDVKETSTSEQSSKGILRTPSIDSNPLETQMPLYLWNNCEAYGKLMTGNNYSNRQSIFETLKLSTSSVDEYFRTRIKSLYGQIFHQFLKTDLERETLKVEHSNDFKMISKLGITQGLCLFREYLVQLKDLLRRRLWSEGQGQNSVGEEEFKIYWKREKHYVEQMIELETGKKELESQTTQRIDALDNLILTIKDEIETYKQEKLDVKPMVKKELLFQLEQRKRHQLKMKTIEILEEKRIEEMGRRSQESLEKETKFKLEVFTLEDTLRKLIESYDLTMIEKQGELDLQEKRISENKTTITILEIAFAETEDRFEEMRITKKLKELLKNIEMADNFKRNRAARVIQAAWRRYRIRKFRKMRRKAKFKRKPGIPGERRSRDRQKESSADCFSSDTSGTTTRTRIGHSACCPQIHKSVKK